MKKRFLTLILALVLTVGCFSGCGLITTDSKRDMKQVVADVNIANIDADNDLAKKYKDALGTEKIYKLDLVSYFINAGYTYINSYGYTYEKTFGILMDSLVSRKIIIQYAKCYYFDLDSSNPENVSYDGYLTLLNGANYTDIDGIKYFLTTDEYNKAVYQLKKTVNNAIDNYEKNVIKEEDSTTSSEEARTTPTGVDATDDEYFDSNYEIYTGKNEVADCGVYEALDNSTKATRKKAYNRFLQGLKSNDLLGEDEQVADLSLTDYYKNELKSQLEQGLIDKFNKSLETDAEAKLTESYLTGRYNEILQAQTEKFNGSVSDYESALGNVSNSSFVLYSPDDGYGFVYNILLPFSQSQQDLLSTYSGDNYNDKQYFSKRVELLNNVKATDQRSTWFDKDYAYDAVDYSYTAGTDYYGNSSYLFFENNLENKAGYEKGIPTYYGKYAYNGSVSYDKDEDEYTLLANKINIDEFIDELEGYSTYAGLQYSTLYSYKDGTDEGNTNLNYGTKVNDFTMNSDNTDYDYSKFIYYVGKLKASNGNFFDTLNDVTKADRLTANSVINELMFAYSTDTGCFNKYMGYNVTAYDTSYVAEFEYAAQYAIGKGEGTYAVCSTQYGWHILYVNKVYNQGEIYDGIDWSDVEAEDKDSFSYNFYIALRDNMVSEVTSNSQTGLVYKYNVDSCVTKYESRYSEYFDLDKNNTKTSSKA